MTRAVDGVIAGLQDYRGDVTYPVFIELLRGTEGLRWGMTASVEIDAD